MRIGLALAGLLLGSPALAAELSPERLFITNCSACHQRNGRGIPQAFPALDGDALLQGDPHAPVALLLDGRGGMPSFSSQLNDAQIAAILTYVRSAWGNRADPVPSSMVADARTGRVAPEADSNLQAH